MDPAVLKFYVIAGLILIIYVVRRIYITDKRTIIKPFINILPWKAYIDDEETDKTCPGVEFEQYVARELKKNPNVYKVYNDAYFSTDDLLVRNGEVVRGTIVQQDVIAITRYGILAIECKDYHGGVVMSDGPEWRHNDSFFQNPVNQNENHIKVIKKVLKDENLPIINMVIFSNHLIHLAIVPGQENAMLDKYPYVGRFRNLNNLINSAAKENIRLTKADAKKYHKKFAKHIFVNRGTKELQRKYAIRQKILNS